MEKPRIEYVPLSQVRVAERNPKLHDLPAIRASIRRYGFVNPLVRDERTGALVAGHGRFEALCAMQDDLEDTPARIEEIEGEWAVPILCGVAFENEAEAEGYLLADNRLVELGSWDTPMLGEMLTWLGDDAALVSGFDDDTLAMLATSAAPPPLDLDAAIPSGVKSRKSSELQRLSFYAEVRAEMNADPKARGLLLQLSELDGITVDIS